MLIVAVGDAHIPARAIDIPLKFSKLLTPGKISQILTLGNVSDLKSKELFKGVCTNIVAVKGDFDLDPSLPLSRVVKHGGFRIGMVSGFSVVPNNDPEALLIEARRLDVDILLWGGSHVLETYQIDGKLFLNPGSVTGALANDLTEQPVEPSFALLDITDDLCVVYIYSLKSGELRVEKVTYDKDGS